jgi:hypothetical protein
MLLIDWSSELWIRYLVANWSDKLCRRCFLVADWSAKPCRRCSLVAFWSAKMCRRCSLVSDGQLIRAEGVLSLLIGQLNRAEGVLSLLIGQPNCTEEALCVLIGRLNCVGGIHGDAGTVHALWRGVHHLLQHHRQVRSDLSSKISVKSLSEVRTTPYGLRLGLSFMSLFTRVERKFS